MKRTVRGVVYALLVVHSSVFVTSLRAQAQDSAFAAGTPPPPHSVNAVPLTGEIRLDGTLDEPAWQLAPVATDFAQWQPDEGAPATQPTEVRFLFDRGAIYIGARMGDELGAAGVVSRLVRRDGDFESDFLQIVFDSFHDHLGQAIFYVNPDGVKGDQLGLGGAFLDASWDPVWEVRTTIDSMGWTAEVRIPFSQLRFAKQGGQTWGLQIQRFVHRLNEVSMWSFYPSTESGGPAFFGHLDSLAIEASPARGEILPYVVGRYARLGTADTTSPFYGGDDLSVRVGMDFKHLLTSNITLIGTINPDFGQVEVDPAVVNLSVFETFFPERRPFFVGGRSYFFFGPLWCRFCWASGMGLFYSRRIGRAPQGAGLAHAAGSYADVPNNATILGAAKITGRTAAGWSVGLLDAVTAREHARVVTPGEPQFETEVEPLTNYFVGRVAKDYLAGNLQVRGMVTSVVRGLRDSALAMRLSRHAEAAGLDAELWFSQRRYRWATTVAVSQVAGDPPAMLRVQHSSARYFQRPDREHGTNGLFTNAYDSTLTAMRGYGVESRLSREAGNWLWELNAGVRSPGFETNDLGFLSWTDFLWISANLARRRTTPTRLFRNYMFIVGGQRVYNFDGDLTARQEERAYARFTFLNYWRVRTFVVHRPSRLDDRLTRGGPIVGLPAEGFWYLGGSTDSRKRVSVDAGATLSWDTEGAAGLNVSLGLTARPASNVEVALRPSYGHTESLAQYVTAQPDSTATAFFGTRYVFADLEQRTLSMDIRLNVTFTPTLTLQLYAQPLLATAAYGNFKEFDRPREIAKSVYGVDVGTITRGDGEYTVDPDGDGPAEAFTFDDPDFNLRSLRGSAVLRWEFRPGSTLYFVWTQARDHTEPVGTMDVWHDLDALIHAKVDNIFLVKLSYFIGY